MNHIPQRLLRWAQGLVIACSIIAFLTLVFLLAREAWLDLFPR
jgi:hypothetical protein